MSQPRSRRFLLLPLALLFSASQALAQQQPPRTKSAAPADPVAIAAAWRLLADGNLPQASRAASDLLTRSPRSVAALALALEVDIARAGGIAGLDRYEAWLGSRTVEDPYAVRRIALALLREAARADPDRATRLEAVEALIADGEADTAVLLPAGDAAAAEIAVRGSAGDDQAVTMLLTQLGQPGPIRRIAVGPLGRTRSPRAIQPLTDVLTDDDPVVRAGAADALGALGASSAIPQLKRLLDDPVVSVRIAAATALTSLNDPSPLPLLQQLRSSEYATIRLAAAQASSREASADWLNTVRALTSDPDPEVRRQAAELIAPHDPDLAKATIEPLLTDANPAERQAAADSYVKSITRDFAVLRRFLRGADSGTRVRAADRVLELTR